MKLSLFFLLLSLSAPVFANPFLDIKTTAGLNQYIERQGFNGVILVARGDKILLRKAYGERDLNHPGNPIQVTDSFQIGSLTKQFVAASLLKLQQEGKLSLDDLVTKHLPEFTQYGDMKVRDLLNQTSGVKAYNETGNLFWGERVKNPGLQFTMDGITAFIRKLPLEFPVRTRYKYSNSNYILAGEILERATGQSWFSYIQENFLTPLQMTKTTADEKRANVTEVVGFTKDIVGSERNSWAQSAGQMQSNADDLLKWTKIYADSVLLTPDSRTQMQTPSLFPELYALGVIVDRYRGETRISHGGRLPGFVSNLVYLKEEKLAIVTLDNSERVNLVPQLLNFYSGHQAPVKTRELKISEARLHDYEGTFGVPGQGRIQFRYYVENGKLYMKPDQQPAYRMKYIAPDTFNLLNIAAEEFVRDPNGKITGVRHHQNALSSVLPKQ